MANEAVTDGATFKVMVATSKLTRCHVCDWFSSVQWMPRQTDEANSPEEFYDHQRHLESIDAKLSLLLGVPLPPVSPKGSLPLAEHIDTAAKVGALEMAIADLSVTFQARIQRVEDELTRQAQAENIRCGSWFCIGDVLSCQFV